MFAKVEPTYTSKDGCRLVWEGAGEDDSDTIILNKEDMGALVEILKEGRAGTITLEDHYSRILVNSDVTQFHLLNHEPLEAHTHDLQERVLEYARVPHERRYIHSSSSEFHLSAWNRKGGGSGGGAGSKSKPMPATNRSSLRAVLYSGPNRAGRAQELSESDVFRIFASRRSTRTFARTKVEDWKLDKILAAADTAPTAGNFQGLKIFYVKNAEVKEALVEAANNQPYVNAPVVLVFCRDHERIKLEFSTDTLKKFAMQDATLAASYAQIAATGLGLSSLWIGKLDEEKVMYIIGTDLRPSSILCIGYPGKSGLPKSKRNLKELIEVIE